MEHRRREPIARLFQRVCNRIRVAGRGSNPAGMRATAIPPAAAASRRTVCPALGRVRGERGETGLPAMPGVRYPGNLNAL
jgi:hypothetical protein